jgi:GntR family transcriptional regulator
MTKKQGLAISIATGDSRSISKQIVDAIRIKVAKGELDPGAQLPSVRGLAMQLSINPNTVAKAYAELTAEGWLQARQGLGLYVAEARARLSTEERDHRLSEAVNRFVNEVVALGVSHDTALARLDQALRHVMRRSA